MRDALSLTDQAIAYGGGQLDEAVVRAMLGAVDRSHAASFVDALARRDGAAVLAGVNALRDSAQSATGTLEEMVALLQQMAIEQAVPGSLDDSDPDTAQVRALAAALPPDETQLLYSIALHGRAELTLAPDEHAALTMVLLRLLAFPGAGGAPRQAQAPEPTRPAKVMVEQAAQPAPPAPAPVRPANMAAAQAGHVARQAAPAQPPPWLDEEVPPDEPDSAPTPRREATVEVQRTPLGDRWADAVARLNERQAVTALVRELAMQAELIAIDGSDPPCWRLRVEREPLRTAPLRDKLQAALAETLSEPLRLDVEAGVATDSPARRDAAERERRQREAERVIHNDPLVQELMGQFSTARIVPGSIKPH
jgi:DNA polymerase-3 subunit gamma/tau